MSTPPTTPTYDPAPDASPRTSATKYRLLAFFLGAFGVHNFAAGHTRKATIQVALGAGGLVLTPFLIGLPVLLGAWAWALADMFSVTHDGDGVPMEAFTPASVGNGSGSPIPSAPPAGPSIAPTGERAPKTIAKAA